jgi:vanillate O-demethylase monooxygenase subunit
MSEYVDIADELIRNELDEDAELRLYGAMRNFWHPVMYAADLGDEPEGVVLLGEELVVARMEGAVRCLRDLCCHRGTALSLGWNEGHQLRCRYHGWTYGPDGVCTSIPSRFGMRIPKQARVDAFHAREQSGLIWVCLGDEPMFDPPEFPEWGNEDFKILQGHIYDWKTSAHRRLENFMDFAHFAYVHDGVLGSSDSPEVPDHDVWRETESELQFFRAVQEPIGGLTGYESTEDLVDVEYSYRLTIPISIHFDRHYLPGEARYVLFLAVSPVAAKYARSFWFLARNYAWDVDDKVFLDFEHFVQEQDRPVVESQRPEMLPHDLTAELHVKAADKVSVAYRRWLVELTDQLNPA